MISVSEKMSNSSPPKSLPIAGLVGALVLVLLLVSGGVMIAIRGSHPMPDSPMAAVGALEGALQDSDANKVRKLLDPTYGLASNTSSSENMVAQLGGPDFQFTSVTLDPTESNATWRVVSLAQGRSSSFNFFVKLQGDVWYIGLEGGAFG